MQSGTFFPLLRHHQWGPALVLVLAHCSPLIHSARVSLVSEIAHEWRKEGSVSQVFCGVFSCLLLLAFLVVRVNERAGKMKRARDNLLLGFSSSYSVHFCSRRVEKVRENAKRREANTSPSRNSQFPLLLCTICSWLSWLSVISSLSASVSMSASSNESTIPFIDDVNAVLPEP